MKIILVLASHCWMDGMRSEGSLSFQEVKQTQGIYPVCEYMRGEETGERRRPQGNLHCHFFFDNPTYSNIQDESPGWACISRLALSGSKQQPLDDHYWEVAGQGIFEPESVLAKAVKLRIVLEQESSHDIGIMSSPEVRKSSRLPQIVSGGRR